MGNIKDGAPANSLQLIMRNYLWEMLRAASLRAWIADPSVFGRNEYPTKGLQINIKLATQIKISMFI